MPNTGTGTNAPVNPIVDGVYFAATGEGGATDDYRIYRVSPTILPVSSGAYAANSTSAANAYYAPFNGATPPATQAALFPEQTGTLNAGSPGFAWRQWEITKTGNTVTWTIDSLLIGTVDISTTPLVGNNVFLGHADINATTTTFAQSVLLGSVIDNVEVLVPVPEPASAAGLAAVGLFGVRCLRRRRG
jgi:hypothetical protein